MLEKAVLDAATTATKLAETAIKKAWSMLDAAVEKKPPSDYLSPNAIQAIQGVARPGEK